jgi:hypothetical protein
VNGKGRLKGVDRVKSRFARKHPLIENPDTQRAKLLPFVAHPSTTNVISLHDRTGNTVSVEVLVDIADIDPDEVASMVETIELAASQWKPKVTLSVRRY